MLLMIDDEGEIVGEIEYFPITHYLQGYEISYQLFGQQHAGKGYTTEAVNLLLGYLLGRKRVNRMQLNIHPSNGASKKVAEKCGFTFEGPSDLRSVSSQPNRVRSDVALQVDEALTGDARHLGSVESDETLSNVRIGAPGATRWRSAKARHQPLYHEV
ncbi:MAG: GNAT family N-acetyltransferase [Acidimicrobiia bacterium]